MEVDVVSGFIYVILAGIFAGGFALPMKFTTGWKWRHNWILFSTGAMLIMPVVFAFFTIPNLLLVYQTSEITSLIYSFLYGLAWGVGVVCFGLGLDFLGVALGMSIMLGLNIFLGALMPIAIYQPEELFSSNGLDLITSSLIIIVGITVCAIAGNQRNRNKNKLKTEELKGTRLKFKMGMFVAFLAGVLSPMQNLGFVAGSPIQDVAVNYGASPVFAGNAIWPLVLGGGFIINFLYCSILINRKNDWNLFFNQKNWYWLALAVSGIVWFLCMMFFGMAASKLGKFGPSIGWASFQTLAIITGNVVGLLTGEWKGSGKVPLILNFIGIIILLVGIIVIAF